MSARVWEFYLNDTDRAVLARGRFGRRMGFGDRPAVVAIDCQRYMVGERGVRDGRYPSSCGDVGWAAVDRIGSYSTSRPRGRCAGVSDALCARSGGADVGVYARKRDFLHRSDWCLEGTEGAQLLPEVGPSSGDVVFVKKKPSAFHGTPLLAYLIDRTVDTLVIVGGATSNCVRATVFNSASYNFRTIVPEDAVFDRLAISHAISLFDMDRQFADVTSADEVIAELRARPRPSRSHVGGG